MRNKNIYTLAAFFCAIITVISCGKTPTDNVPTFEPPVYAEYAQKLTVDTPESNIAWMEFTEAGRYIIAYRNWPNGTKAVGEPEEHYYYVTGTYTVSGSDTYVLSGFGTVEVSGNAVTIEPEHGDTVTMTVTTEPTVEDTTLNDNVARSWKIDNVRLGITTGSGVTVNVTKQGCDIHAIAAELKDKGVNVDPDTFEGFIVKEITFTKSSTFMISFTQKNPYVGGYTLSSDGKFHCELDGSSQEIFYNGTMDGNVTFEGNTLIFTVNLTVSNGEVTRNGTAVFFMSEAV